MSTPRNETGILLEQIDAGLIRIAATLDQGDLIMRDIDQAARDPEQVAFEDRNRHRCVEYPDCTNEGNYECCMCGAHLCWPHTLVGDQGFFYCSIHLPEYVAHLQW